MLFRQVSRQRNREIENEFHIFFTVNFARKRSNLPRKVCYELSRRANCRSKDRSKLPCTVKYRSKDRAFPDNRCLNCCPETNNVVFQLATSECRRDLCQLYNLHIKNICWHLNLWGHKWHKRDDFSTLLYARLGRVKRVYQKCIRSLPVQILLVRDFDRSVGLNYGEKRKFWKKKCVLIFSLIQLVGFRSV